MCHSNGHHVTNACPAKIREIDLRADLKRMEYALEGIAASGDQDAEQDYYTLLDEIVAVEGELERMTFCSS